jgi:hypothetical protein
MSARREASNTLQFCYVTNAPSLGYRTFVNGLSTTAEMPTSTAFNATHEITMIIDGTSGRCLADGDSIMTSPVRVAAKPIAVIGSNVIMNVDYLFVVKMP